MECLGTFGTEKDTYGIINEIKFEIKEEIMEILFVRPCRSRILNGAYI
jgi:hypothetical protein